MERWTLEWDRGRAEVISIGAMLHDLVFRLDGGREARPFAEAPWRDDAEIQADASLPAHLRQLGGDWACVPFGTTEFDPAHHGHGSNADWRLVARDEASITLACDFPEGHAVERLERTVRGVAGEAAVEMAVTARVRRDCRLPIGLHPIFRVPEGNRRLTVEPGAFGAGQVFPEPFLPGLSRLEAGARFATLGEVPLAEGGSVSVATLPAPELAEELVQLWQTDGTIVLRDAEAGAEYRLTWDAEAFPHCLLWISNGGRTHRPWNGRFRGLGIEPVASAFDRTDLADLSLSREGTGQEFRAGEAWTTSYRLEAR
ncbi:hypothetical protein GCM10011390_16440 [Aureimonas endophytica]|uniref:Galactose mutarotase-like enzyme n=1 Tax=Aureimonas endophytica TaxID=2027858 RepID=A0A916ZI38_9HYPH|nr:hypothetical protein [Aureimonas endophytica]GGD98383.1 hypothetical protein GCM10011390_16440 [Aureimonas endophytica]